MSNKLQKSKNTKITKIVAQSSHRPAPANQPAPESSATLSSTALSKAQGNSATLSAAQPNSAESSATKPADVQTADEKFSRRASKEAKQQARQAKQKAKQNKLKTRQTKQKSKNNQKDQAEKPLKEVFILARPFVGIGRYLRDSWREIRLVRWPNRKATWKMTAAVLIYCAIFMVFILLIDMLFTFIFEKILGN